MIEQTPSLNSRKPHNFNNFLLTIGPTLIVFVFNLTFFNRYFPVTEGWWETYGYLINHGLIPYKDFNVEFPPFVIFINAFYLKYISSNFFILRLIGVIIFSFTTFLLQKFLEFNFEKKIAATIALFSIFLCMSDIVFIAKDYHTYTYLFVISTLLFIQLSVTSYQKYTIEPEQKGLYCFKTLSYFLISGLTLGILTLVKQNIGLFLFLSYILTILVAPTRFLNIKSKFLWCMITSVGYLVIFAILAIYFHTHGIDLITIKHFFIGNDSKGSIFVVLFRFLIDPSNRYLILSSLALLITYYISVRLVTQLQKKLAINQNILLFIPLILILIIINIGIYKQSYGILNSNLTIISLAILTHLFLCLYVYRHRPNQKINFYFIVLPLMALTYCNTQTAGLNFSGMSFVIAFTFSYLFTSIPDIIKIKSTRTWYLMPLLILPLICIQKYQEPYEWWGLAQSSIPQAKYSLLSQKTKGMHVDKMTKTIFNTINTSIKQFSKTNNDVYLFPDIPIFYYLNDKIPPYKNPVLWFDVISSQHIKEELINFKQHLPEVIVFLDPPDFVYAGHANLIKRSLIQLKFKHLFEHLVDQGIYRLHKNIIYCQKLNDLFYTDKSLKRTIILKNKAFDNKSLGEIHSIINDKASFIITGIIKQGVLITNLNNQIRIKRNDMLIIKTTKADLKKLAENLGYIINSDYYTLKIYVKNHPK